LSRRLEEVEGGEREAQPRGWESPQQEPGCMGTSGSSSSIGRADPGLRTPSRAGGGKGGVVRRKGRDRVKAIRNPDCDDLDGLLREAGAGSRRYESGSEPSLRSAETTGSVGSGGFKFQGAPNTLKVILSG
jgi:hypothetical protein